MKLTDYEWLRFVTFALVVGVIVGSLYTTALVGMGRGLAGAATGAVLGGGVLAVGLHLFGRYLLARDVSNDEPQQTEDTA